jgi:hypothetical protein
VCPPDLVAWEELLVAQAASAIFDTTIDQVIAIVAGLEDARAVGVLAVCLCCVND